MYSHLLVSLASLISKPTGISNYTLNLLPHLKALDPTVLAAQPLNGYRYYPIAANQTSEAGIGGRLRRLYWTQLQLPNLYQDLRATLLFSPLPEAPIFTPCRYIVMAHDLIPLRFPKGWSPRTLYFRHWVPHVFQQAQHIICNSIATANDLHHFFHIPTTKITPIPLAYDDRHFTPQPAPSPSELSLPYFLYIGHHEPYKNLSRLISAFALVVNSQHDTACQLWLAGPTDNRYTPQLKAQVNALGIDRHVQFLDYAPYAQLPDLLRGAVALVFPSLWEGFGIPVLEAMACGTPVITSNLAAMPEVAGEAAILVDPYNIQAIAAAMRDVLNDRQLRQHLQQAGLRRAQQFRWSLTGQHTVDLLRRYL
ncbi:MAG: glycosyltransferase family 4 protein [Cyanobacteria bacterium]|nr:glycosyltransferase family 4 protein [Cyanobacteriota bacterium]MDW8201051.1 glycosyltransferase family 1 protein [Cyanobacteriota bacterium SKYGB_h_bin112]